MIRAVVVGLVLVAVSPTAEAYVRTTTSSGTPVLWDGACAAMKLSGVENPEYPSEKLHAAFDAVVSRWEAALDHCAPLNVTLADEATSKQDVGYDGTSLVRWRLSGACEDPAQADSEICHSPNAAAITTVFYVDRPGDPRDGELLETDLELNGVGFQFGDDGEVGRMDMQNTLSHELGHIMGLDHTCYTRRGGAPSFDSNQDPVPYCFPLSGLPEAITESTMFNFADPGESKKRSPGPDEVRAVCELYASRPATCTDAEMPGCGCELGEHAPANLAVGVLTFLLAVFLWPSRRKRRPPDRSLS